jgi:catechol 2,3-dioxygenase-like lactoylglutathione lyase family enzyme
MQNKFVSVIPELPVCDVAKALQYYRDILGYEY